MFSYVNRFFMMRDAIENFSKQLIFEPIIQHSDRLVSCKRFIVAGMGGSHLAGDLLRLWDPALRVVIHSDYGLPAFSDDDKRQTLVIASSYSGNTEETLDAYAEAGKRGYARVAIAVGGKLLGMAKTDGVPYVQMPDTGIQPRSALGFSFKALLKIIGADTALAEIAQLAKILRPGDYEDSGRELAAALKGRVPVVYASRRNESIAYNWKIKFNETGKIPAFYNAFPELNHNEMTGLDVIAATKDLSRNFSFIFLKDAADDPRIIRRMEITERLYRDRGLPVRVQEIQGSTVFEKIFSSLLVADWAAYYTAEGYGAEAEAIPMVEELKKLIAQHQQ